MRLDVRRRVSRITALTLCLSWLAAWGVVEAATRAAPDIIGLPWFQALAGVGVSFLGGLSATLTRYAASKSDSTPFIARAEFIKDGAVSVSIGVAGYFGGWSYDLPPDQLVALLVLAGFGGAKFLSTAMERTFSKLFGKKENA